ncbi:MAG: hypothetical protein KGI94_05205 [Paracoccaceae bacterium]|nr:hypothetical protein [Paracoccaceae bacterium]MDE3240333.1 hypothetical protein [Paracoccaceae bacterium]
MSPKAAPGGLGVWLLAAGQTTGYATFNFSFAALLVALSDPATGAHMPRTVLAAGPTLALILAALIAPRMGRLVDRGKGALLLRFGPLVGAAGLAIASFAQGMPAVWIAGYLLVGLAEATTQFETCFALLIRRLGPAARGAIVRVTLVAGFSATLAFPLGDRLAHALGWQGALLALAAIAAGVTVPLNIAGTALIQRQVGREVADPPDPAGKATALRRAMTDSAFWRLAGLIGLIWLDHAMLTTFALPLLTGRGADHGIAVMLAAGFGPAQVAGRVMLLLAGEALPLARVTLATLAVFVLAGLLLMFGHGVPTMWLLYVLAQGGAAGIATILRPVLAAEILGRERFGAIWGVLSVAPLMAQAVAPMLGALLLGFGGSAVILAALAMAVVALLLGFSLRPRLGG